MEIQTEQSERFQRGWQRLIEVDAEGGQRVIESLKDIAPDLGRYVVEFAYGDIYQRPVLDLRQRQLVTISALTALGGAEPQLEVHINAERRPDCPPGSRGNPSLHPLYRVPTRAERDLRCQARVRGARRRPAD
jgi:alkylhydroperoxidase/carboxymuconolactone decarboxylase family protein YurZ